MIELPNVNPDDAENFHRAELRCADLGARAAQFLVDHCPGFGKSSLRMLAPEIGFHSVRQILGRASVSDSDVLSGRNFAEAVATCAMPGRPDCTFQVPPDALRVPALDNLVVTGRTILPPTALFATNSQPASMELGEAAGTSAAKLQKDFAKAG